ncbi:hypothetical protein NON20_14605 [Synechocystis sp. B12]|nr:hypothetical protein NON20_14605 [Synechocystis sp. B12]
MGAKETPPWYQLGRKEPKLLHEKSPTRQGGPKKTVMIRQRTNIRRSPLQTDINPGKFKLCHGD